MTTTTKTITTTIHGQSFAIFGTIGRNDEDDYTITWVNLTVTHTDTGNVYGVGGAYIDGEELEAYGVSDAGDIYGLMGEIGLDETDEDQQQDTLAALHEAARDVFDEVVELVKSL